MPLTVGFTYSQSLGYPNLVTLTDTSTGSNVAVVGRRVYFTDANGKAIVSDGNVNTYESWPSFPSDTTESFNVLKLDKALYVKVDWVDAGGATIDTLTKLIPFNLYAKTFYLSLIKAMNANNKLKDSANFFLNLGKLETAIKQSEDAVNLLVDISSSQAALTRAKKLIDNSSNFY